MLSVAGSIQLVQRRNVSKSFVYFFFVFEATVSGGPWPLHSRGF